MGTRRQAERRRGLRAAVLLCALWTGAASAQQAAPASDEPETREAAQAKAYADCMSLARSDPDKAMGVAAKWEREGGDEAARHCAAVALLNAGQYTEAARRLEALAATTQRPGKVLKAELYAQAGQAWLIAGDAERALAVQSKALEIRGGNPELLIDRAITLASLGKYWEAIDDLNAVIDIDSGRIDALIFRATAWRKLENLDLALDDIGRVIALAPTQADALLERGIIRRLKGEEDAARADWRRVVEVAPDSLAAQAARENLSPPEAAPAAASKAK